MTLPELWIANSVAPGPFPLDCFFRSAREYELCFGEPWHGLGLKDCWAAIGKLLTKNVLDLSKTLIPEKSTAEYASELVLLGLTQLGGEAWERAFGVRWDKHIWIESDANHKSGVQGQYKFYAENASILEELATQLRNSTFADCYAISEVLRRGRWAWSNWKTFESAYSLSIAVTEREAGHGEICAGDALFALCKEMSSDFKQDAPSESFLDRSDDKVK